MCILVKVVTSKRRRIFLRFIQPGSNVAHIIVYFAQAGMKCGMIRTQSTWCGGVVHCVVHITVLALAC